MIMNQNIGEYSTQFAQIARLDDRSKQVLEQQLQLALEESKRLLSIAIESPQFLVAIMESIAEKITFIRILAAANRLAPLFSGKALPPLEDYFENIVADLEAVKGQLALRATLLHPSLQEKSVAPATLIESTDLEEGRVSVFRLDLLETILLIQVYRQTISIANPTADSSQRSYGRLLRALGEIETYMVEMLLRTGALTIKN